MKNLKTNKNQKKPSDGHSVNVDEGLCTQMNFAAKQKIIHTYVIRLFFTQTHEKKELQQHHLCNANVIKHRTIDCHMFNAYEFL